MFHPVHQLLFTGSTDQSIKVWDPFGVYLQENSCLQTMYGHDKPIFSLVCHYDLMLSGGADQSIRVWKPDPSRKTLKLHPWFQQLKVLSDFDSWINVMWASPQALSGDQGELVVGDMNGNITLYKSIGQRGERNDIVDFRKLTKIKIRKLGITHIIMLYANNLMITVGFDNIIRFMDSTGGNTYSHIKSSARISGLTWIAHHEEIVSVDVNGKLEVYQYRKGKVVFTGNAGPDCTCLSLHPDNEFLLCSGRSSIQIFKINRYIPHLEYHQHSDQIIGVHLSEDNNVEQRLVTAGADNQVCVWYMDKFDMLCKNVLESKENEISASLRIFNHTKVQFITGHDNGDVTFWNFDTGRICRLPVHTNTVSCFLLLSVENKQHQTRTDSSPNQVRNNRFFILSGSYDGSLAIAEFEVIFRKPTFSRLEGAHPSEILCLLHNRLNDTIISGANDGSMKIWSKDLQLLGTTVGHERAITSMVLDGYFLFSGSEDCKIFMWNSLTMQRLKSFNFHQGHISSLRLIPGNGSIVSISRDGFLFMWNYSTSTIEFSYKKSGMEFTCVEYDRERQEMIIGTVSGAILRVSLKEAEILEKQEQEIKKKSQKEKDEDEDEDISGTLSTDDTLERIVIHNGQAALDVSSLPLKNTVSFNMFKAKKSLDEELNRRRLREEKRTQKKREDELRELELRKKLVLNHL